MRDSKPHAPLKIPSDRSARAYRGYALTNVSPEDEELTHVGPGTPCGELFRRFWQPVALASKLGDVPLAVRILGEDLVAFRDLEGRVGVLHRHCCHRGASLEYGIVSQRGIRCSYHGWLYDVDGVILETPGEPPESPIRHTVSQGAYPAREFAGLVFAYMGPPGEVPPFPCFDTYEQPDNRLVPFSLWHPCNWLQLHENMMDPVHAVFLHTRVAGVQLTEAWGAMPEYDFRPTPNGMMYITAKRWDDYVWIRSNHTILPNFGHTAALWEDGDAERLFTRASVSRWAVPIDDTHTVVFGVRHFNPSVDPKGYGNEAEVGEDSIDFMGQTGNRPYAERQRDPGDWDVQVSQRPIAVHALEHRGRTDKGVIMLRRALRDRVRGLARGDDPDPHVPADGSPIRTYAHDTVLWAPREENGDDRRRLRELASRVTDIVTGFDELAIAERQERIERELARLSCRQETA